MLFELVIFAVVLVTLQMGMGLLVTYLLMKKFMSKKFIKEYSKMAMEAAQEVAEEMEIE